MAQEEMMKDDKAEKFREFASKRTNDVCKKLQSIGKLSNRAAYHYTDEQIDLIFFTIEEQVKLARESFQAPKAADGVFIKL